MHDSVSRQSVEVDFLYRAGCSCGFETLEFLPFQSPNRVVCARSNTASPIFEIAKKLKTSTKSE